MLEKGKRRRRGNNTSCYYKFWKRSVKKINDYQLKTQLNKLTSTNITQSQTALTSDSEVNCVVKG